MADGWLACARNVSAPYGATLHVPSHLPLPHPRPQPPSTVCRPLLRPPPPPTPPGRSPGRWRLPPVSLWFLAAEAATPRSARPPRPGTPARRHRPTAGCVADRLSATAEEPAGPARPPAPCGISPRVASHQTADVDPSAGIGVVTVVLPPPSCSSFAPPLATSFTSLACHPPLSLSSPPPPPRYSVLPFPVCRTPLLVPPWPQPPYPSRWRPALCLPPRWPPLPLAGRGPPRPPADPPSSTAARSRYRPQ